MSRSRVAPVAAVRALAVAAFVTVGATVPSAAATAETAAGPDPSVVASVVAGWAEDPVHVDEGSSAFLDPTGADELRARIEGEQPPVFIAAVPARVLSTSPGSSDATRARAFVDAVVDDTDQDGVYIVSFAGAGTYGSAVGVDLQVGPILEQRLTEFSLSEPVPMLHTVLDDLGVPGSPERDSGGWVTPVLIGVGVVALGVVTFVVVRRRRSGATDAETTLGPSTYRPSFDVLPDEADSTPERRALAREDVTRFGEELDAADLGVGDPVVAADVQAALDAYADAAKVADGDADDDALRAMRRSVEYGRWRLARGRARLAGEAEPARRAPCFFDAGHGVSVSDWRYRPAGGAERDVPVCDSCLRRMEESGR